MKQIIIMSLISTLFGSKHSNLNSIKVLDPVRFEHAVSGKDVQLVDVRTSREFRSGHIKGATNIDFLSSHFEAGFEKLNKDKPLYIYCRSGSRSRKASRKLQTLGFSEIYDLQGGYIAYNH